MLYHNGSIEQFLGMVGGMAFIQTRMVLLAISGGSERNEYHQWQINNGPYTRDTHQGT